MALPGAGVMFIVPISTGVGAISLWSLFCLAFIKDKSKTVAIITAIIPKTRLVYDSPNRRYSKTFELCFFTSFTFTSLFGVCVDFAAFFFLGIFALSRQKRLY